MSVLVCYITGSKSGITVGYVPFRVFGECCEQLENVCSKPRSWDAVMVFKFQVLFHSQYKRPPARHTNIMHSWLQAVI